MKSIKSVIKSRSLFALAGICFAIFGMLPAIAAISVLLSILGIIECAKGKRSRVIAIVGLVYGGIQLLVMLLRGETLAPGGLQSHLLLFVMALGTFLLCFVCFALFSSMWNSGIPNTPSSPKNHSHPEQTAAEPASKKPLPASAYLPSCMCSIECEDKKITYTSTHRIMREICDLDACSSGIPADIVVSRWLAEFICRDLDYEFELAAIGGGSTEVSHTGDVAYHGAFSTLDSFFNKAYEHYRKAEADAEAEYGSWFTGLNYSFIIIEFKKPGCSLQIRWDSCIKFIFSFDTVFTEGAALSKIHKYLFSDKNTIFADKLSYDGILRKLRHTIQLDEERRFFLSTFVSENGCVEKLSLDIEEANDRHYEFSAAATESFRAALEMKLGKKNYPLPSLCAAVLADFGEDELENIAKSCYSAIFSF